MKIEAGSSSDKLVPIYQITRRHILVDSDLNTPYCKNLKPKTLNYCYKTIQVLNTKQCDIKQLFFYVSPCSLYRNILAYSK
jgi:hypothetical protein